MTSGSLLFGALLLLAAPSAAAPPVHVVQRGDSLGAIAERYGLRLRDLRRWNDLDGDVVRVGEEIALREPPTYRTVPGDTLWCIAERFGVSADRIREGNAALRRRGLEAGMTLRIRGGHVNTASTAGRSQSVGSPMCGYIEGPVSIDPHPAFVLRNRARAYVTARTAARLRAGFDALRLREPSAPRVRVHDASLPHGGAIDDHRTHQSGRDVDITYFQTRCGRQGCPLRALEPDDLDARRQWTLLRYWLRRGEAEAIYVDYSLQPALYREAQRRGATEAELAEWFQYPRGPEAAPGILRHFPNHVDHVHVRFACHPSEARCRE